MASKRDIDDQLRAIIALLEHADDALSVDDIARGLAPSAPARRTLNRRLARLLERDQIIATDEGRARKYSASKQSPARDTAQSDEIIPLSRSARDVLDYVRQPIAGRDAVAYNREFLEDYEPNTTFYLSQSERDALLAMGRTQGTMQAAGTYALQILNRLLIDLSWNSSRLEGNTYSLLETQRLIEAGQGVDAKAPLDAQMILNHKAAIEYLVENARTTTIDPLTIKNLHALLSENLLDDPAAAGRLRRHAVAIGGSSFLPLEVPQQIEECFATLLSKAAAITDPFEQSLFLMVQLPYLQAFVDVNKRVSRLALNIPLIRANLAPLSFIAVPEPTYVAGLLGVYERNNVELIKEVFIWAYGKSSARYVAVRQTLGEPDPFRLRYRTQIKQLVADVIRKKFNKTGAAQHISRWAGANISSHDRAQFIETVETELLSLHDGNFARYGVTPNEFTRWNEVWTAQ